MNRTPALKVLIASSDADTRVAVSWMLRQLFPDATISRAETLAEARQIAVAESSACVFGDASLPDFAAQLSEFAQTLWQQWIPLIVIHDRNDAAPTDKDTCPGITAWLSRATVNVSSIDLAVSKAIELSMMSHRIETLEQELNSTRDQLTAAVAEASRSASTIEASVISASDTAQPTDPLALPSDTTNSTPLMLERPRMAASGSVVSTDDEQELAGRVQKDLMPAGSPLIDGFDIAGLSIPATTTGGDYYDYLPMADDLLCISIGECSGRGLAPAMFMASVRAYLRVLTSTTTDISDVLSQVNTLITEDIGDEEFMVTLLLCQIEPRTRMLKYASAGHQAFFLDRDGNVDVLPSTGMPLGLREETVILEGSSRTIRTGEILLLASDGVRKMTSDSGEQFGTDRMLKLVNENRNLPSRIIANYLRKACTEFASPQFQNDDITIVIIKGDDS
ncbi:MAG: SpoIIE family protein phosphatase [Rhodopirellula sp.]|nr:SpoIIE family protein phosphatase [Rhodopirellula sp.]